MSPAPGRRSGYLLALLAAFSAAAAYLFADAAVERMHPLVLGSIEFLLASPFALLWAWRERQLDAILKLPTASLGLLLLQVAFTFGAIGTLWAALRWVDPTTASLLNRTEVLFTVALGLVLFRERPGTRAILGGLLAFAGVLLLRWNAPPRLHHGSLLVLASAACFAGAELTAKALALRMRSSLFLVVRTPLLALVFLAACAGTAFVSAGPPPLPDARGLAMAAGVALCGPVLARAFYFGALRRIEISRAAMVNQCQPLFVALLAFLLWWTVPGPRDLMGGAAILAGTLLLIPRRRRLPRSGRADTSSGTAAERPPAEP